MILYLSAGIDEDLFFQYQQKGYIKTGFQAQRFNSLVIQGLAYYKKVIAISNPPYAKMSYGIELVRQVSSNIEYICLGNNPGHFHKAKNLKKMIFESKKICKKYNIEAIICDAINPLASLTATYIGNKCGIPKIAIVTDLPTYMDKGKETFFTKLTQSLLERYEGYILLTKAMDKIANPRHKPYMIMEGLCEKKVDYLKIYPFEEPKKFICLYTGSVCKDNGIEQFIAGFLKANIKNSELWIYGPGNYVDEVKSIAEKHKNIKYYGITSNREVLEIQKKVSLLINPRPTDISYGEFSFPSKVMEYMASGTPLLTTHLPGIPEEYFNYVYEAECSEEGFSAVLKHLTAIPGEELRKKGLSAQKYVQNKKNHLVQAKRIIEFLEYCKND